MVVNVYMEYLRCLTNDALIIVSKYDASVWFIIFKYITMEYYRDLIQYQIYICGIRKHKSLQNSKTYKDNVNKLVKGNGINLKTMTITSKYMISGLFDKGNYELAMSLNNFCYFIIIHKWEVVTCFRNGGYCYATESEIRIGDYNEKSRVYKFILR